MFKRSEERGRNRLPGYNYSNPGFYFITICTKNMIPKVIHGFNSCVTRNIRNQFPSSKFAWQRSFYDHIIINKKSMSSSREYNI
ncbi:MAG: hypothetical protein H8D58_03065 [Candidatus Marinimicrobia bacterium]|nr:hypothetical protein [Candidatus Neomarinimicrobiota bacterium]